MVPAWIWTTRCFGGMGCEEPPLGLSTVEHCWVSADGHFKTRLYVFQSAEQIYMKQEQVFDIILEP